MARRLACVSVLASTSCASHFVAAATQRRAVKVDTSKFHMHNKFAIIDSKVLINGSFNWSRQAVLGVYWPVVRTHPHTRTRGHPRTRTHTTTPQATTRTSSSSPCRSWCRRSLDTSRACGPRLHSGASSSCPERLLVACKQQLQRAHCSHATSIAQPCSTGPSGLHQPTALSAITPQRVSNMNRMILSGSNLRAASRRAPVLHSQHGPDAKHVFWVRKHAHAQRQHRAGRTHAQGRSGLQCARATATS